MDYDTAIKLLREFKPTLIQRMKNVACEGETISYSEWIEGSDVEKHHLKSHEIVKALSHILGEIGEEIYDNTHMLTAVVVSQNDRTPGLGFYELAGRLGFPINKNSSRKEKEKFFKEQLEKTHECWAKNKDQS